MKTIKKIFAFDKNCLLCKFKYDDIKCFDAIQNRGYHCPSLSNIFYGKILKLPVIKQIYDIYYDCKLKQETTEFENNYINEYETKDMKWIWGIRTCTDFSSSDASLYTMNDIDVIYFKNENKYSVGIETMYVFDNKQAEYNYLNDLLNKFTEFMKYNGYDTGIEFSLYEVFTNGININSHFDSLEECYAAFKMFVNGFCIERR